MINEIPLDSIRVDLEIMPNGMVEAAWWFDGYKATDEDAGHWYFEAGTMFQLCKALDDRGYTVHVDRDGQRARALSGQVTRIDIITVGQRWVVSKYPYGWTATTGPLSSDTKPAGFDVGQAVDWLNSHGWIVYQWDYEGRKGFRAFRHKPEPVNDTATIVRLRKQYPNIQADLAYIF